MSEQLKQHGTRLLLFWVAFLSGALLYAVVVYLVPQPPKSPLAQANHLLWVLAAVTLLNVVTLTPVQRAMLAGPLRVYAVSHDEGPLLRAHLGAQIVLYARLEAIAIFGLVLYFLTGRADWFWAFAAIATVALILLWPSPQRVRAVLGLS